MKIRENASATKYVHIHYWNCIFKFQWHWDSISTFFIDHKVVQLKFFYMNGKKKQKWSISGFVSSISIIHFSLIFSLALAICFTIIFFLILQRNPSECITLTLTGCMNMIHRSVLTHKAGIFACLCVNVVCTFFQAIVNNLKLHTFNSHHQRNHGNLYVCNTLEYTSYTYVQESREYEFGMYCL